MEKRYDRRRSIRVRVSVHDRLGRRGTFETRNATAEGLFIETGRLGLATGDVIWIEDAGTGPRRWPTPLSAVVVHRAGDGIGVLLSQPMPEVFDGLVPMPARGRLGDEATASGIA
jgi:hypothetical protein